MADPNIMYAREYFLGVTGLALMRSLLVDREGTDARTADARHIVEHFEEFPQSLAFTVHEHDVDEGYARWAPRYDGPNPAIAIEEPVVHGFLEGAPRGVALDAACGTGRHAAYLASLGYDVIGVDGSDAMLDVARAKVPAGDFRRGSLERLPVDDASVEVVTCSLALTHVADLAPPIAEFARVLRRGGRLVISDIHPFVSMLSGAGGAAVFPTDAPTELHYVRNRFHPIAAYVGAFAGAGLTVTDCAEPLFPGELSHQMPSYAAYPGATEGAFAGLPYVLVWRATKP
jgi:ubiquinone/menaquinone biosynthesis C-methylase UbiE